MKTTEGYGSCRQGCRCSKHGATGGQVERHGQFLLTVRSRSGRRVNMITGAPEDTVMVHSREDLERRIRAAEQDPDLELSYRDAAPPPQASSLKADRPEPDWSWLDGADDGPPAGDFWADDEPEPEAEAKSPRESRHEAKAAETARRQAEFERWEADMKADAERRGLPAYRPLGTKASWWRKR
jgi:hypothetical protein